MRQLEYTFIIALVFGILGFLTCFIALLTPAWQVVYARELEQWIQSGLWLSCQTRPNGMYTCTYTFSESDFEFYTSAEVINLRTPPFYAWQRKLLVIFMVAQLCAFISFVSFCCSFHLTVNKASSLAFSIAMSIAVLIHIIAAVAFSIISQMVEYRFYHVSVSGIYEKHRGYSFYIELFGTLLLMISLILSIVHVIKSYFKNDELLHTRGLAYSAPSGAYNEKRYFRDGIFDHDHSQEYHPHAGSFTQNYSNNEDKFAMRDLPPLPIRYS